MKVHAVVNTLCVLVLAGCAAGPDSPEGKSNSARLRDSCLSIETQEAMAGSPSKAPLSEPAAKTYAEYLCNAAADTCTRDQTQPTCQRNLKKYGLIK